MNELLIFGLLFGAGLLAGFINTIAGGGSTLTLPALMLSGLGPMEANASNRIAIFVQSIVASAKYRQKNMMPTAELPWTVPWMLGGGLAGALCAAYIPRAYFEKLIYVFLTIAAISVFFKSDTTDHAVKEVSPLKRYGALLIAGFYGGFLQAGVGYILLWALHSVSGIPFKRANALKMVLVIPFTGVALAVFL